MSNQKFKLGLVKRITPSSTSPTSSTPPTQVVSNVVSTSQMKLTPKTIMAQSSNSLPQEPERMTQAFDSLNKMNEYLKEIVENNVFFMFTELLHQISNDYVDHGLTYDELKNRYLAYFRTNMKNANLYSEVLSLNLNAVDLATIHGSRSNSPNSTGSTSGSDVESPSDKKGINEAKCYARTSSNLQCSRKKQSGSDFCGSHVHNHPYGRVDQPVTVESKSKKDHQPTNIGVPSTHVDEPKCVIKNAIKMDEFEVEAMVEIIDGLEYIIDTKTKNIYKTKDGIDGTVDEINMDDLNLVGKKLPDGTVKWYLEAEIIELSEK
jgi:hypothetical protein